LLFEAAAQPISLVCLSCFVEQHPPEEGAGSTGLATSVLQQEDAAVSSDAPQHPPSPPPQVHFASALAKAERQGDAMSQPVAVYANAPVQTKTNTNPKWASVRSALYVFCVFIT